MALAGIDLRVSAACWCDAVWAIIVDAPHKALESAEQQMTIAAARAKPDRDTWGVLPEHQALMRKAQAQGGSHGPAARPDTGPRVRRGNGRPV